MFICGCQGYPREGGKSEAIGSHLDDCEGIIGELIDQLIG